MLEQIVPRVLGVRSVEVASRAIHDEVIPERRLDDLAPHVLAAAADGDAVAQGLVDRLADEVAAFAIAAVRSLHLARREIDVAFAGGLARSRDPRLLEGVERRIREVAPSARLIVVDAPPVLGAALLGLDALGGGRAELQAARRIRLALASEKAVTLVDLEG